MALKIISVVLFTVFFSEALTLVCYNCPTLSPATCNQTVNCTSDSQCSSMNTYGPYSNINMKQCANSSSCVNSSINLGWVGMSSQCCSSDYCNNATDLQNQLKCYTCDASGTECLKTQTQCKGDENQCITITVGSSAKNYTWKGCASTNMCNITLLNSTLNSLKIIQNSPLLNLSGLSVSCSSQGIVSAGSSTFPAIFHLRPDLGGFLLILLVFGCSVLSI